MQKIFRGVISGVFLTAITMLVALINIRLILDYLPKEVAGVWFLFLSIGTYIGFFDMGVGPTISRKISFLIGDKTIQDHERKQAISNLFAASRRMFQVLSLLALTIGLLAGGLFIKSITSRQFHSQVLTAWVIFSFAAALNLLNGSMFAALFGLGNVVTERIIRSISQIGGLVAIAAFLHFNAGITGLATACLLQAISVWFVVRRALRTQYHEFNSVTGTASFALIKEIVPPSLKWAAMGLGAILILNTDNIVIGAMIGPEAIPSYEAVAKIILSMMTLSLYVVTSSTPFLSRAFAANDIDAFRLLLMANVRYAVAAIVFFASFLAIFGERVIDLWLGHGKFVGNPVLWALLTMTVLEVHHVTLASGTLATGRIVFGWIALIAGILNIILSVLLAPPLGVLGVALGTMITQILTNNWYAPYVTLTIFNIPYTFYARKVVLPLLGLFSGSLVVNVSLNYFTSSYTNFLALCLSFPLSAIVFVSAAVAILFTPEERSDLFRWIARIRQRMSKLSLRDQ